MPRYLITAQSYTSSQRIARTVSAGSEAAALRYFAAYLNYAGFYVIDVKEV